MSELYEVDPDGDLLIILISTEGAFAPWNDPEDLEALSDLLQSDPGVGIISSPITTDEGNLLASYTSPSPSHFKVSSKHLILASRYFEKMLTGVWKEANIIHPDGYRHVTLEGFDPTALKLLLDIIHGKNRKVPRSLDLEMLAKVSVLVDDFECHEEIEVFSEIWLRKLSGSLPTEYNRDLVLRILVSSVFRQSAQFKSATRTAILHSNCQINTLGLPVRSTIVDEIDRQRWELLDRLIGTLHSLLDKLCGGQPLCSFECDSILLGALIKQMRPYELIWPRPSNPFTGFNFVRIAEAIRCFQSPAWCSVSEPVALSEPAPFSAPVSLFGGFGEGQSNLKKKKKGKAQTRDTFEEVRECPQNRCTFQILLDADINRLEKSVKGLDLQEEIGF